jgi:tyrosyl-tRNA synthetase
LSARALEVLAAEIPYADVPRADAFDTLDLFFAVRIAPSKGAIRRLLEQGGLSVNGRKLPATDRTIPATDALPGGYFLLRKGARDYALARLAN